MVHLSSSNNSKGLRLGFSAPQLSKTKIMVSAHNEAPKVETISKTINVAVVTRAAALSSNKHSSLNAKGR